MPVHIVPCLDCGVVLTRKTYWRKPKCAACGRKVREGRASRGFILLRQQARRYRIIMHVLGWDDGQFEEMLSEIRNSPMAFRRRPESRSARYDLAIERRAARPDKAAHRPAGNLGAARQNGTP